MKGLPAVTAAAALIAVSAAVSAAGEADVTAIRTGASREEVHSALGTEGKSGLKEAYTLDNGKTAVAHYDNETLVRGFIVGKSFRIFYISTKAVISRFLAICFFSYI